MESPEFSTVRRVHPRPEPLIGREKILDRLQSIMTQADKSEMINLIGPMKSGRTSLLARAWHLLEHDDNWKSADQSHKVVYISARDFTRNSNVLAFLNRKLTIALDWGEVDVDVDSMANALRRYVNKIRQPLVILIDDATRMLTYTTDDSVWAELAALRISLVNYIIVTDYSVLRKFDGGYQSTYQMSFIVSTPLFMEPLSETESRQFVASLPEARSLKHRDVDLIVELARGHVGLLEHCARFIEQECRYVAGRCLADDEIALEQALDDILAVPEIDDILDELARDIALVPSFVQEPLLGIITLQDSTEAALDLFRQIRPRARQELITIGALVFDESEPYKLLKPANLLAHYVLLLHVRPNFSDLERLVFSQITNLQQTPVPNQIIYAVLEEENPSNFRNKQTDELKAQFVASTLSRIRGSLRSSPTGHWITIEHKPKEGYLVTFSQSLYALKVRGVA
jgi:hypothetical protein